MTSRAALTIIRHGATLASGLMRSGSYMKPVQVEVCNELNTITCAHNKMCRAKPE